MFSKSDRICFQPTYNPPVGHYEINHQQNAKGIDFSKSLARNINTRQNVSPQNNTNNLPRVSLASPQLSAYAKPGERLKFEQKYKKPERRSFSYSQNADISINNFESLPLRQKGKRLKIVYQKQITDQENSIEESTQLQVQGYYNSRAQTPMTGLPKRRKPKTHRNIFSLFPSDSLELAQQREKMKDKPVPPPGAYYNEFNGSSIKVEKIPWRFQCFSSTAKRFSQQQQDAGPSVGAYDIKTKSKAIGVISLDKYSKREDKFLNFPGVGSYDVDQSFTQQKPKQKQQQEFPSPFGSSGKRF
ncbi:unnamed protein product (macronuclear) [Paramecium tetraurelia]|uniref:Sperm-tail PG-rich repeat protein n=1 Tax=Paramecium tetraurelia TaxID=5888 RepID=A0D6P9_PARTE|nr:uncharacterized protein GSPATT00001757001 [Paramecium tetraurelia]CAK78716.1 unnamed protein product [Paramecium tetraurelia]|eukprot:XP_001446113.1 hypothetical protein (macronuclear) [Paramecium tetraurelia strain d4-2]